MSSTGKVIRRANCIWPCVRARSEVSPGTTVYPPRTTRNSETHSRSICFTDLVAEPEVSECLVDPLYGVSPDQPHHIERTECWSGYLLHVLAKVAVEAKLLQDRRCR